MLGFARTPPLKAGVIQMVIRVYDNAGNVIEMHEHTGDFKEP